MGGETTNHSQPMRFYTPAKIDTGELQKPAVGQQAIALALRVVIGHEKQYVLFFLPILRTLLWEPWLPPLSQNIADASHQSGSTMLIIS